MTTDLASLRVAIAFRPDDRPGEWMYHCHILEHHATGMMGHFEVVRPASAPGGKQAPARLGR